MTNNQIDMAIRLSKCTFLPGSYQKRFARMMLAHAANKPDKPLTERQAQYLAQLFHMYRKQIGTTGHNIHCELCNQQIDRLR